MPLHLLRRRSQVGASVQMFLMMITFLAAVYYLPFFYQAKGRTPSQSGIDILPFMMTAVFGTFFSGAAVNVTGNYWWFMVIAPLVGSVGAGVLFTIDENTSKATLIGFQILLGLPLGLAFQLPSMFPYFTSIFSER